MMEVALYLLPVTLGETPVENVLPVYNKEVILGIKHFIVEDVRSARRFLTTAASESPSECSSDSPSVQASARSPTRRNKAVSSPR